MSYYYKMKFVSPEPLYAEIKEMLRSYFESGAVDDLMFPRWTNNCLARFANSTLKIKDAFIDVTDHEGSLPDDFETAREVWMCTNVRRFIPSPSSFYYQKDMRVSIVDDICGDTSVPILSCNPCDLKYRVANKVTNEAVTDFTLNFLLKPGNIHAESKCGDNCSNLRVECSDTFDIRDCKLITSLSTGSVYILYYSNALDEEGDRFIPENIRIQEYIKSYITYKIFEFLSHQVTDETANQIENKMKFYKIESDKCYIIADSWLKSETLEDRIRGIKEVKNRYRNYRIR